MSFASLAVVVPALWAIAPAAANPEVTVEVPAAVPVSAAQAATFGTGVMPALGVYQRLTPHLALGLRARIGALGDGGAPMAGRTDAGWGGLATLAVAVRAGGAGAWLELAGGGGVTGVDPVPALEAGAGWATRVGPVEAGPALRLIYLPATDGGGRLGAAQVALIGLELRPASRPARRPRLAPVVATAIAPPNPPRTPPLARAPRDADALIDRAPGCASDPTGCGAVAADGEVLIDVVETCRVLADALDDHDACAAGGDVEVARDRIILADRVLFKVRRARVRRAARPVVRAIAAAWTRGAWQRLIVEGHADVRGDTAYNLWLSQERAARARAALIAAGVPADAIEAVGYGATRPRSADHDANRRVEFVVVPRRAPEPR